MSLIIKTLFVVVFVAIGSMAMFAPIRTIGNEVADDEYQAKRTTTCGKDAESLYLANCARCHGAGGKSDTELGSELDATDLTGRKVKGMSISKLKRIVRNGKGEMPGFAKKLATGEVSRLVLYIRTLK